MNQKYFVLPVLFIILILTAVALGQLTSHSMPKAAAQDLILDDDCVARAYQVISPPSDWVFEFKPAGTECHSNAGVHGLCNGAGICVPGSELEKECNYITDRQICDPPVYGSGDPAEVYVCGSDNKWHLVRQCPTSECEGSDCSWPPQDCVIQRISCPDEPCYPGETIDIKIGFSNWSYQEKPYTSRFIKALARSWSQIWCDADKPVSSADNTETIRIECDKLAGLRSTNPNIKTGCSASSITGTVCEIGFAPDNEEGCQISYSAIPEKPTLKHENKLPQSIFWQWAHARGKVTEYRFYAEDGSLLKTLTPSAVCQSTNAGSACSWEETGFGLNYPANSPITHTLSACNVNGCSLYGYSVSGKQPYQDTAFSQIEPVEQAVCARATQDTITVQAISAGQGFSNLDLGSSGIRFQGQGQDSWQKADIYTFSGLNPKTEYSFQVGPSRNGDEQTNGAAVSVKCTTTPKDCTTCGDGLLNTCDQQECLNLGNCIFVPGSLINNYGKCGNSTKVEFQVNEFIQQKPVANALIRAAGFHKTTCTTNSLGICTMNLAMNETYEVWIEQQGYSCDNPECRYTITPQAVTPKIVLQPKKIIQCADSDADGSLNEYYKNYFAKGTATDLAGIHEDYCVDDLLLIEYYCSVPPDYNRAASVSQQEYYCPRGCYQGACLDENGNPEKVSQIQLNTIYWAGSNRYVVLPNALITITNKNSGAFVDKCTTDYRGMCTVEIPSGIDYVAMAQAVNYLCNTSDCPKEFTPIYDTVSYTLYLTMDPRHCSYGACDPTEKKEIRFRVVQEIDDEKIGVPNALVQVLFDTRQKAGECRTTEASPMYCSINLCPNCMYYATARAPGLVSKRTTTFTPENQTYALIIMIPEGQTPSDQNQVTCETDYWCTSYEDWQSACQEEKEGYITQLAESAYCLDKNSQVQHFCGTCKSAEQPSQCENLDGYCEKAGASCQPNHMSAGPLGCELKLTTNPHCCLSCVPEGSEINTQTLETPQECCLGLTKISQDDDKLFCVKCGNNVCDPPEDANNCPRDCLESSICQNCGQGLFNICDERECLDSGDCVFTKSTLNLNNQCISRDLFERANMSAFLRRIDDLRLSIVKIKAQINTASKNQLENFLDELDDLENKKISQLQKDIADSKLNQAMKAELNQRIEKLKTELKDARAQINKALEADIGSDMISASEGGMIETTLNGKVVAKLIIPPQALYTDAKATIDLIPISQMPTRAELQTSPTGEFLIGADRLVMGNYFFAFLVEISTGEAIRAFAKPITIIFQYLDSQLAGLEENSLTVYYFEETIAKWAALPTTVDLERNTLTIQVKHLTLFGVAAAKAAEDGAGPIDGQLDEGKKDVWILNPLKVSTIQQLIDMVLNWLLIIAIPLATIIIIWSALLFMTSGGEPKRVTRARRTLIFAVIGIAILLLAKGMSYTIANFLSL